MSLLNGIGQHRNLTHTAIPRFKVPSVPTLKITDYQKRGAL